jgi:hypothetical protein
MKKLNKTDVSTLIRLWLNLYNSSSVKSVKVLLYVESPDEREKNSLTDERDA